jgi:tight adherence protein B
MKTLIPTILVFLLVFAALYIIAGHFIKTPELARDASKKKKKSKSLKNSKIPYITRLKLRTEAMLAQLKMSRGFYIAIVLATGVVGYFVGQVYFQTTLISIVTAVFASFLPQVFFTFRLSTMQTRDMDKLESTMLVLSNSYLSSDDFIKTVQENIDIIEYPQPFREFLVYVTMVDSNIETSLRRLEYRVNNSYFSQWIDMLVMAQKDRSMKMLTLSVVDSMNDAKRAQMEVDTAMSSVWREYAMLMIMIFSTPILLRLLMRSWYDILVESVVGKVLLVLLMLATAFSVWTAMRVAKPINERYSSK